MIELTFWDKFLLFILFCISMWYLSQLLYAPIAIRKSSESLEKIATSLEKIAAKEGAKKDE